MPSSERLGPLRLHERLAARGAASTTAVHLGWLVETARLVAVKRLHPLHVSDAAGVERVSEEARLAMDVDHPNVVPMLGVLRRPGEMVAAMDYVPSASLAEIAKAARGGLEPRVATAIAAGVLRGLHAVHEVRASVVPRVVSSDRVLVGEDGHARVLHFDVSGSRSARAALDDLPYAAPEQLLGKGVDVRRDVFAVSVVLWQTLTGRSLFGAPTVHGVLQKIVEGDVPAPSTFAPGVDRKLDSIVLRGLARDAHARFESASAMSCELEATACASADEVARLLAEMDLACIRWRSSLADTVRRRESASRASKRTAVFAPDVELGGNFVSMDD